MSARQMVEGRVRRGGSKAADAIEAVADLHAQIGGDGVAFALIFCSPQYDLDQVCSAIRQYFGDLPVFGCTTAGEITPFGYISGGLCGISFPADDFAVVSTLFDNLSLLEIAVTTERTRALAGERDRLAAGIQAGPSHKAGHGDPVASFALLLIDGMSAREEQVVSTISNTLAGTPLVGGSAGDDLNFQQTFLLYGGRFVTDAALLLLIVTRRRFSVFKTEHFAPTEHKMVVTGANVERRTVTEINAEPAALEYARMVGLSGAPLTPTTFAAHPLVVRVAGQYHVRSIQKVNADQSLTFLCAIEEGLVLTLARSVDIVENLEQLMARLQADLGPLDVIIGCDCVLRNLEIEERQLKTAVSDLFVASRVIGFCTYGEQFNSMHVNQTFTGVAVGVP